MFNEEREVVIGKVLSPHGVTGMVKIFPLSDHPQRVSLLDGAVLVGKTERLAHPVEKSAAYGRFWLVKFKGIDTREAAASIREFLLVIPKEKRLKLPEDSFYHDQLAGLAVYDTGGVYIGKVKGVTPAGAHDLLLVESNLGQQENELLVPLIKKFIKKVDLTEKQILVDLPAGLLDL